MSREIFRDTSLHKKFIKMKEPKRSQWYFKRMLEGTTLTPEYREAIEKILMKKLET